MNVRRVRLQGDARVHRDGHADIRTDRLSLRSKLNDGVEGEIINMYQDRASSGRTTKSKVSLAVLH